MNLCNNPMIVEQLKIPDKEERMSFKKSMVQQMSQSPLRRGLTTHEFAFTSEKRMKRNSMVNDNDLEYDEDNLEFDMTKTP